MQLLNELTLIENHRDTEAQRKRRSKIR